MGYFDDHLEEVRRIDLSLVDSSTFILGLQGVEGDVIRDVLHLIGDREFPDDWREEILTLIALYQAKGDLVPTQGMRQARMMRMSPLIAGLKARFDDYARKNRQTRFGLITADVIGMLQAREASDLARQAT